MRNNISSDTRSGSRPSSGDKNSALSSSKSKRTRSRGKLALTVEEDEVPSELPRIESVQENRKHRMSRGSSMKFKAIQMGLYQ